jgi:hypothetical protein
MYTCNKCNKVFEYESKLREHKNRKTNCNRQFDFNCNICKSNFKFESDYLRHEKTKKHKKNLSNNLSNNLIINNNLEIIENENLTNQINELNLTNQINELKNKIKYLEIENQNLKNNNKIHSNNEYIYIIHPAHCINMNVYKIGRTKNIMRRFKDYPKGSELIFTITCNNSILLESEILNYLRNDNNYINAKDYGLEYFQCNLENLKNDISKIIKLHH